MTPKERVDRLMQLYDEGGEDAIDEFARTEPIEYLHTVEATFIVEDDMDGLAEFRESVAEQIKRALTDRISEDGFSPFENLIKIARQHGEDETAERLRSFIARLRN